jgi:hypothetical protein
LDNSDVDCGRSNRSLVLFPSPENDFSTITRVLQHVDFLYHKVNIIRRNDEDRTVGDALRILFKSPRESPEVVLVYNIEDVVYKDFALPKIISPNNKLIIVSNDHADAKDSAAESQINADSFLK